MRRWLDALPPEVVRGHAQLSASYAWCLVLAGETEGVADRLADADRALADGRDGGPMMRPAIPTQLALLRSQLAALEGDSATAIAQARLARELVPAGLPADAGGDPARHGRPCCWASLSSVPATSTRPRRRTKRRCPTFEPAATASPPAARSATWPGSRSSAAIPTRALRLCEAELERTPRESAATDSPAVWAVMASARAELGQAELADGDARRALELATRAGDAPCARLAQATLERVAPLLASGGARAPSTRRGAGPDGPVEALTARELEVLRLVALGRSNSQVATELFVTVGTVKSHVHTISGKLGAANRTEAVARGRELGLLS